MGVRQEERSTGRKKKGDTGLPGNSGPEEVKVGLTGESREEAILWRSGKQDSPARLHSQVTALASSNSHRS